MGELMKHGCTTCFDHHYVFPAGAGDLIGAQLEAAEALGIRMACSRGSMDLSVKDGGLPPDSVVQTVDEIMADSMRLIEAYHDPSFGSMHTLALAPCSPFSVSAELLRQSAILARQYGVRLHTHLCETKDEEAYMLVPVGLGVDGSASNDGSSLMEELRTAFLLHRLHSSREAPSGYEILKMATRGSARLLGRSDIGALSVGQCCDLFLIDSRRLELTGACFDPCSVLATRLPASSGLY